MPASTYREVLDFWFGTPNSPDYGQSRPMWFRKSDAFDAELTEKFGPLVAQAPMPSRRWRSSCCSTR